MVLHIKWPLLVPSMPMGGPDQWARSIVQNGGLVIPGIGKAGAIGSSMEMWPFQVFQKTDVVIETSSFPTQYTVLWGNQEPSNPQSVVFKMFDLQIDFWVTSLLWNASIWEGSMIFGQLVFEQSHRWPSGFVGSLESYLLNRSLWNGNVILNVLFPPIQDKLFYRSQRYALSRQRDVKRHEPNPSNDFLAFIKREPLGF